MIKLKVFWLKKPAEERDIPMYRSHGEPKNISKLNISSSMPHNYVVITNPSNSNCICSIFNLQFDTNGENKAKIYMGEDLVVDKTSEIKQADILQVLTHVDVKFEDDLTELDTTIIPANILDDHYTILLPGGSLILKIENSVNNCDLTFDLSTVPF